MLNRSIDGVIPRVPKRNLRDSRRSTIVTLLYLSVSNSLSGRYWEPDQVLQWETQLYIVQLGTGHGVFTGERQRRVALQ